MLLCWFCSAPATEIFHDTFVCETCVEDAFGETDPCVPGGSCSVCNPRQCWGCGAYEFDGEGARQTELYPTLEGGFICEGCLHDIHDLVTVVPTDNTLSYDPADEAEREPLITLEYDEYGLEPF